jgi:signal recognition particle subunit SRP54
VTVAENSHQTLELDGVILTKLDGDARGGAALSVKEVVGKPIAFASTGEKLDDFDLFHPDRLAGRILGMGDILTLIDKAKEHFDEQQAEEAANRMLEGQFTLEDFLEQMAQVRKMGNLGSLMKMMPGMPKELRNQEIDDRELSKIEGLIHSMTLEERRNPKIIDGSRKLRIAKGAGVDVTSVNALLKQFGEMQKMMKGMGAGMLGGRGKKGKKKAKGSRTTPKGGRPQFTLPPSAGATGPGGKPEFKLPGL